jgi:hypothetical protein
MNVKASGTLVTEAISEGTAAWRRTADDSLGGQNQKRESDADYQNQEAKTGVPVTAKRGNSSRQNNRDDDFERGSGRGNGNNFERRGQRAMIARVVVKVAMAEDSPTG